MERFLDDLAQACSELLPEQLPGAFYEPVMRVLHAHCEHPDYARYLTASVECLVGFTRALLPLPQGRSVFTVPLSQVIGQKAEADALEALVRPFQSFPEFRRERPEGKEFDRMTEELIEREGYDYYRSFTALNNSFFYKDAVHIWGLFDNPAPYLMHEDARFQHTWIISPTGTGKTTLLENLIMADIEKGSVVVLDGENQLIPKIISHLPLDRVVLLEPDEQFPLALNLFDSEAIDYHNSTELADFVLGGLMGAELTGLQSGLFRHLARAMTVIPNATIFTLTELLDKGGYEVLRPHVHKLDDYTARFFQSRFNEPGYNPSKQGLWLRLDALLSDTVFKNMFSHPRNRLNLSKEIEAGKVVLISTKALKTAGREAFGRFMIAMLMQATEKRLNHTPDPSPVYLYVDEAHDYIANEPLIAIMGDKVRKQRLAMTFAHTRMSRITHPDVKDWLSTCRVKFAGRMTNDAPFVAKHLQIEPEILMGLPDEPPYKFAFTQGKETVVLGCPPPIKHGPYSYEAHQKAMRERYCAPLHDPLHVNNPILVPPKPVPPPSDGDIDLTPTKDW